MEKMNERLIWLDGKIIPLKEANINVLSPTSQFGANVFEGIRCYWNEVEKQLYAFRLDEHFSRLKKSVKMFKMEERYTENDYKIGLIDVVRANNYKEDVAVRQTVFIDGFGNWASRGPVNMFISPIAKSRNVLNEKTGYRACISSWERISDKNLSPKVKVGANYINSRMAQLEAIENGFDQAIFLNNVGKVAEGPGSALFIVRDNILITPSLSSSVLESITRDTLIKVAKEELGLSVVEREVDRTELYICDEVFLCGSAVELTPILNVDGYVVGDGKCGSITRKLHDLYMEIATGKIEKYRHWLTPIYDK